MAGVIAPPFDPANVAASLLPAATATYDLGSTGRKWKDLNLSGALTVAGAITGSLVGNASTATALATPRTINGVAFDGTAGITVPAAAGTLTGATLAAGVTASSLTSVGTLTSLTLSGLLTTAASAVGGAGFRLPHGTAPTSPANGDVWTTTAGLFARVNGATVGPFATSAGTFDGNLAHVLSVIPGAESDTDYPITARSKSYSHIRLQMPTTLAGSTFRNIAIHVDSDGALDLCGNTWIENWRPAGGYQWHTFDATRNNSLWSLDSAGYACYYWRAAGADPAPSTSMFGPAHLEFHPAPGTPNVLRLNMPRAGEDLAFWLCPTTDGVTTEYMTIKAATGRVGIGTNAPDFFLTVRKDQAAATYMNVVNASAAVGAAAGILVGNGSEYCGLFYFPGSFMLRTDSSISGGVLLVTGGPNPMQFRTDDLTRLTIGGTGDLTIDATNGGKLITRASSTAKAGFNLPHGAAPTSVVSGDMWTTAAGGLFVVIGGVTKSVNLT